MSSNILKNNVVLLVLSQRIAPPIKIMTNNNLHKNGGATVHSVTKRHMHGMRPAMMYTLLSTETVNTAAQCHPRIYVCRFCLQGTAETTHPSVTDVRLRGEKFPPL